MTQHIDELAELYALGVLDEEERARVDAHALACDACASRLGEAESTIAFMEQRAPVVPASLDRRMSAVFARPTGGFRISSALVAAAFIVGLLPSFWFWNSARTTQAFDAQREQAVHAMVTSHFAHAQFTPLSPGAPKAKLIYARTGDWVYAVAATGAALTLQAQTPGGSVGLGTLHATGNAGELFVAKAPHAQIFTLSENGREIERVTLPKR